MPRRVLAQADGVLVHPLSYIRAERGWSYQDLVDVIARRAGNMARRREKAWRWEHGGVVPDRETQIALAAELGIRQELIDMLPWQPAIPTTAWINDPGKREKQAQIS
ncbi:MULTISPECIES: hypothetical protein [unclassified Streptosporangium]|uniref:hypothetical protein n=1 Tax=unclassified Streptosporangium TaxID=2632669 RepID=UPI002E2D68CD|nr:MULTISPECIES: hypothetical protein [unclassified Streptosporangium]